MNAKVVTPRVVFHEYVQLDGSRKTLVQRVGDGTIISRFEKTPLPVKPTDVVCPHFLELKWANGCPFDCSWCYLKGTLRFMPGGAKPRIKDLVKVESHVRAFLAAGNGAELLNSGELADSLMWERRDKPFSAFILALLSGQKRHRALFVTKSKNIDNLISHEERDRAVVSFSLNADIVSRRFERGAPSVKERIEAAAQLSRAGFEVRVRIDPIIPVEDWEHQYEHLVDDLFSRLRPSRVTLGSLRGLQTTINRASDKSWVAYLSDKSNWGRKIELGTRLLMYESLINHLIKLHNYSDIALCKETVEVWERLGMDFRQIKCNCVS